MEKTFDTKDIMGETVLVVSGLPRSGTSLMMKMLEAGGLPPLTDKIRVSDDDNPKGYYEFERVKKMPEGDYSWLENARGKGVKVISALLQHLPPAYHYRVVFMRRNMQEILASQKRMLTRSGQQPDKVDDETLAALYHKHVEQVKKWLARQENIQFIEVDYNRLLSDPEPEVKRINTFLFASLDEGRMLEQIDPGLYRQRR
jgi:hypothetical protein